MFSALAILAILGFASGHTPALRSWKAFAQTQIGDAHLACQGRAAHLETREVPSHAFYAEADPCQRLSALGLEI